MIDWQVDYYDPEAGLPMLAYESNSISIEDLPTTGVVFIWFRQTVDGTPYTFKCQGWDNYFVKQDEAGYRFGGWMDEEPYGREFRWNHGESNQTLTQLTGAPEDLEGCSILQGIMVPQPDSIILGLE